MSRDRSLRTRVLAIFGAGSIVLTAGVATFTYRRSEQYLVTQRRTYATRQANANARLVEDLAAGSTHGDLPGLLASLETPAGSIPLLYRADQWFSAPDQHAEVPRDVQSKAIAGRQPAYRRYADGGPRLVVGVPLVTGDAYFEIFPLTELGHTLAALRAAFVLGGALTLAGSLVLGTWAGRRLLEPVVDIGRTAKAITGGDRDRRVAAGGYHELADLAASFNQMVEHLNQRIERDARFASNVSHELRSPLTTLSAAVQGMQARRRELDPRSARLLDLLSEEVARFDALVQDLLEISRDEGELLRREPITLEEIGDLARELAGVAPVVVAPGTAGESVRADRRRLQRAIANLVRNADSHGGGVVAVQVLAVGGSARIEVDDNGPGVPEEERERIFERFYRRSTDAGQRGRGDGLGLGLSLVAEHVRLNDGRAWVEASPGGGARFVIELPLVPSAPDRGQEAVRVTDK